MSDDDVIETPAKGIPAVILEEIGAGRGCGVVPVEESVVARQQTDNVENKLDINGGWNKDGSRSKAKSSVYQDFIVPFCASL